MSYGNKKNILYNQKKERGYKDRKRIYAVGKEHPHTGEQRATAQRRVLKGSNSGLLWFFFLMVFFIYVGGYTYSYITREKITEAKIVYGSVDSPIVVDGVIIRDEVVYRSAADGMTVYAVNELSRVKKGEILCSIEDAKKVAQLEEQLANVNTSIMSMQNNRSDTPVFDADIQKANTAMKKIVDAASFKHNPEDIRQIYTLVEKIEENMEYRNKMLLNEDRGSLKNYTSHKELLSGQLSSAKQNVYAEETGIFTSRIDGQEEQFTLENMDTIAKERMRIEVETQNLSYERDVTPGSPLFKIVRSNNWYIAAYMQIDLIAGWVEGEQRTIYVDIDGAYKPLETSVYSIEKLTEKDEDRYVIFKCTKWMPDYLEMRGIRFKIDQGIKNGLKVPATAVADKTLLKIPQECIFVSSEKKMVIKRTIENNVQKDEQIQITITGDADEDDPFVYVIQDYNKLRAGDVLMVENKPLETRTISEIENASGVYVTNSGATVFKRIYIDGDVSENADYIILDPQKNSGIKVHDKIVTDIKNIVDKQMVY